MAPRRAGLAGADTESFVIQYRTPEGRPRRVVIGRYGLTTVEEARTLAHEKLVAVSKGVDPVAEEAKAAGLLTVIDICDWYIAESEVAIAVIYARTCSRFVASKLRTSRAELARCARKLRAVNAR